ncbi:MAG: cytidylate kinase-like family protein [Oscillospiraceae bacterium]|nr:cytidylate kinase-like family protein [Oscillospiraceae bacterium]
MEHLLITISREFGSGGGAAGELLAEKLGIAHYDRLILDAAAQKRGIDAQKAAQYDERLSSALNTWFSSEGQSISRSLYNAEASVMKEIAARESAVFIGRCADDVLMEEKPIRVFLYADKNAKLARTMRKYQMDDPKKALAMIRRNNTNRKNYYEFFTMRTWMRPENYDFMLNTSTLTTERIVEILKNYVNAVRK